MTATGAHSRLRLSAWRHFNTVKGITMPLNKQITRITTILFSPKVTALAAVLVTLVILGCMCLNFGGGGSYSHDDPVLAQEGSVNVPPNAQLDVFYPIPYGPVPNLNIDDCHGDCSIVEQKENHFRVFNKNPTKTQAVEWKAKGMRVVTVTPERPPVEVIDASPPVKGPPGPPDGQPNVKVGQPK
jgi:hypothetical protein